MEEPELCSKMHYLKYALWTKVANQSEQDFTGPLWDLTVEESQTKQWLNGPFTWQQLEDKYEGRWLPCRRFAVWQSGKWRPIDDLSENGVNASYTTCEKISLRALDDTIWCAMTLMRLCGDKGYFDFRLSAGSMVSGEVHHSWSTGRDFDRPHVKTVDLKSAYKQWAIAPPEKCKAIITLQEPSTKDPFGFECLTLPFGAISSVICFNRIARLYQRILHEVFVLASNYYDDYPVTEISSLTESTERILTAVARLLGFVVSSDKELPFSPTADMLGVTMDLSDKDMKFVKVRKKETRIKEMATSLGGINYFR